MKNKKKVDNNFIEILGLLTTRSHVNPPLF